MESRMAARSTTAGTPLTTKINQHDVPDYGIVREVLQDYS